MDNATIAENLRFLYRHLVERGQIKGLDNTDERLLHIFSADVLQRIQAGDPSWKKWCLRRSRT